MSRTRATVLVALLSMAVGALSFTIALQVFDDGRADPPPAPPGLGDGSSTSPTVGQGSSSTSTTTTSIALVAAPGDLETPAWVAIVASEGSEATAAATARRVAAAGHPAGYLRSDDYASLSGGHWVAYSGPYVDAAAATAAVEALAADGFEGAYVRCVGSKKQCDASDHSGD